MVNAPEGLNLAILRKVRRFDLPKMFFLCIPAVLLNTMLSVISSWIWNFQETLKNIQNNSELLLPFAHKPVDANGPKDP